MCPWFPRCLGAGGTTKNLIFHYRFFVMHYLYILFSKKADRYYVGETPDLDIRLSQHVRHHFKSGFTKTANDWKIVLSKKCGSKEDAIYLEKFIQRMQSRKFVEKIIADPTILDDVLSKM